MSTTWEPRVPPMLNKVPEVTLIFWTIKILSTTVGETGADYLAVHVGLGADLTMACMAGLLIVALILQLSAGRYVPWIYWLTVVLVSIVGTQITDFMSDKLEISLYVSTAVFACARRDLRVLVLRRAHALDPHHHNQPSRAILLGRHSLHLCAGHGGRRPRDRSARTRLPARRLAFAVLIAFIAVFYSLGVNPVLTFWLAYILTRPLGASLGDLLSQSRHYGGVGLGTIHTSLAFLTVIVALVAWMTFEGDRAESADPAE